MLGVALIILGVSGALGQFVLPENVPFALTYPFKGNPLVKDTTLLTSPLLTEPWTIGTMKTMDITLRSDREELCLKNNIGCLDLFRMAKELKEEIKKESCLKFGIDCDKNVIVKIKKDECIKTGLGCMEVFKEERVLEDMKEKCLKIGAECTKEVVEKIKIDKCLISGVGCLEAFKSEKTMEEKKEKCKKTGLDCTLDVMEEIKKDQCIKMGYGCEELFMKEDMKKKKEMCLMMGFGCTKEVLEKIKLDEPEKLEKLCKEKGICMDKMKERMMMIDDKFCLSSGLCIDKRTLTTEELCRIAGLSCKFVEKDVPKMVILEDKKVDLCLTAGIGCIVPKTTGFITHTTKFI